MSICKKNYEDSSSFFMIRAFYRPFLSTAAPKLKPHVYVFVIDNIITAATTQLPLSDQWRKFKFRARLQESHSRPLLLASPTGVGDGGQGARAPPPKIRENIIGQLCNIRAFCGQKSCKIRSFC